MGWFRQPWFDVEHFGSPWWGPELDDELEAPPEASAGGHAGIGRRRITAPIRAVPQRRDEEDLLLILL